MSKIRSHSWMVISVRFKHFTNIFRGVRGPAFIIYLTRGIFHAENKFLPWHFQAVAILSRHVKRTHSPTIRNSEAEPTTYAEQWAKTKKHVLVCVARQIVLKLFTQHAMLITSSSSSNLSIGPNQVSANDNLVAADHGVVDVLPQRPFRTYYPQNVSKSHSIRLTPYATSTTVQHTGNQVLLSPVQRISRFCSDFCMANGPV